MSLAGLVINTSLMPVFPDAFHWFALNLFVMWVERRLCASVVKEATLWVKEVDGVAPSFPA